MRAGNKLNSCQYGFMILIAVCLSTELFSQNIASETIEWHSSSTFAAATGEMTYETSKIVTSPTQIIWYDDSGATKQSLDILTSEGSWNNVANNGSILIKVKSGESFGIAQFSKSGNARTIRIQLVLEEESPIYEFTITDVNAL